MKHLLSTRDCARCSILFRIVNIHYVLLCSGHHFSQDNMPLIHSSQQPWERGTSVNISHLQMRKIRFREVDSLDPQYAAGVQWKMTLPIRHLALDFMLYASARCYFRLTATLSCQAATLSIG